MRPNLRINRNKPPSKLADVDSAPMAPRKPKKQSKRKPTRRKALAKAPTAAEEVVDAAEQLVALQRFGRALNGVNKPAQRARSRTPLRQRRAEIASSPLVVSDLPKVPAQRARSRTPLEQRLAQIASSPPIISDLPEVSALCAGALPAWTSPGLPPSRRMIPPGTPPHVEDKTYEIEWTVRVGKELQWADSCPSQHFDVEDRVEDAIESTRKKINQKTQKIVDETFKGGLQAVITAKNIKPYHQSIGSKGQFLDKVDDIVNQLHKEKKQDIRVSITLQLTVRDVCEEANEPTTPIPLQPLTQAQKSAKRKATKRASEQVDVLAAANEATHNHVAVIALKHKCESASCRNFKKCCLALGASGHLPLTNRVLLSWNTAINEGKATVEAPPMSVVGSLFAEQAQAKSSPFFQPRAWQGPNTEGDEIEQIYLLSDE